MEADGSRLGVQVIARAAAVLRSLKNERAGLSLGQIAERVGLPRSTVQRIVGALQEERFVIAAQPGRGIKLGPELHALAESARLDVVETLHPYLLELGQRTGETIDLAVLRNDKVVFVDQIPSRHRLRAVSSVGEAFPMTTTANGKACLSRLGDDKVRAILAAEQPVLAANPAATDAFLASIRRLRDDPVAFDRDEHTQGISAVGMAFLDPAGNVYAISIPIPSARFDAAEQSIENELRATIRAIEALFSAAPPR